MYADQYEIYHGNANPELARKIAHWLASEPGRAEVFEFANENIFVRILDNVREKDIFLVQPTSPSRQPVDHGAPDHDRRLQAGVRRADHGRRARTTPTAAPTRRTSRASRSRPASSRT